MAPFGREAITEYEVKERFRGACPSLAKSCTKCTTITSVSRPPKSLFCWTIGAGSELMLLSVQPRTGQRFEVIRARWALCRSNAPDPRAPRQHLPPHCGRCDLRCLTSKRWLLCSGMCVSSRNLLNQMTALGNLSSPVQCHKLRSAEAQATALVCVLESMLQASSIRTYDSFAPL